jgi:hypothetical protein
MFNPRITLSKTRKTTRTKAKGSFKFNFQIRNKIRLCDSKTITQELRIRTRDVKNMDLYYVNICKHEYEKNMTRL